MGKVPMQVVKEFEHQARQNLSTLNFSVAFNHVISECNLIKESCRNSLKATSKRVKTQIQKGANLGQSKMAMKGPMTIWTS